MSIMTMTKPVELIYKKFLKVIKKDREIKSSDLDVIALLALNLHQLQLATTAIENDGFVITSTNDRNVVIQKTHPALGAQQECMRMSLRLIEQLGLSPKAKALLDGKMEREDPEADDPINNAFNKLNSKRK